MDLEKQLKLPSIEIKELTKDHIKFVLDNCQGHLASALRRILLSEIPTMAPNLVTIIENTCPLPDEYIAHRIGMIPFISANVDKYKYNWECSCPDEENCTLCKEQFEIDVKNNSYDDIRIVTSQDIRKINNSIKDGIQVEPIKVYSEIEHGKELGIPLLKLASFQQFKCRFTVEKGIGKMHSKWSPVSVAAMRYEPIIELQPQMDDLVLEKKKGFVASCPTKVYNLNEKTQNIEIQDISKCMYCDECTKYMAIECIPPPEKEAGFSYFEKSNPSVAEIESYVSVKQRKDRYLFNVETNGVLKPAEIVKRAFDVLKKKLLIFKDAMNNNTEILQQNIGNI